MYSSIDDDAYVLDSKNFIIVFATTLFGIALVFYDIYEACYGTDLCWLYEKGVHIGFYDLKGDKETTIDEIQKNESN